MNNELQILMLEDEPAGAELVVKELGRQRVHCTKKQVMMEVKFLEMLHTFEPELNLADYSLPSYNCLAAFPPALNRLQRITTRAHANLEFYEH